MKSAAKRVIEVTVSGRHGYRVVTYDELRLKASQVARSLRERYSGRDGGIVIAPILMGGGMPARLILDALAGCDLVRGIVPCQIARYAGIGRGGRANMLLSLSRSRVAGRLVVGVDDLADGGETLRVFNAHAIAQGALEVDTAVIFSKPGTSFTPGHVAETGVTQWLVMPGEENAFMTEVYRGDREVASMAPRDLQNYFEVLGMPVRAVLDWLAMQ